MPALDLNNDIELDTGTYRFVEHSGNVVRLRCTSTDETLDLSLTELCRRAVGLLPAEAISPRDLDAFKRSDEKTRAQRKHLTSIAAHIIELATGQPMREGIPPRAEYDPAKHTREERIKSKILELNKAGIKTSRTTLQRMLKNFEDSGAAGLIDRRTIRTHQPLANLDLRLKDCLLTAIADRANKSTGTLSQVIANAQTEYHRRYGVHPEMPSRSTMYRYLNALADGKHITGSARTRQSLANRPQRTFGHVMASLPGEEVQVDSTKMDVLVRLPKGGTTRPILTIAVDVFSRSILAATIRLEATKGVDHALLLAHMLTLSENRPDRTAYRAALGTQNPNVGLLSSDERVALESARPFVHPRRIQMDNGKDYASSVFLGALKKFHIDATLSAPHTPTDKAIVERTFGSINSLFTQALPGYVGRSPEHKGHQVEEQDLIDVFTLYELFDDWVLRVWQNRAHEGLRDPWISTRTFSPNQMLRAAARVTSTLYLPLTPEDYISLLPTRYASITATGVRVDNKHYDSEELHTYRGLKSSDTKQNGKWAIKVDPYNSLVVWVVTDEKQYIECRLRNEGRFDFAHAEDMLPGELDERLEVAAANAALNGAPVHESLTTPPAQTTFSTAESWEDVDDELPDFDPDQDIY